MACGTKTSQQMVPESLISMFSTQSPFASLGEIGMRLQYECLTYWSDSQASLSNFRSRREEA